MYGFDLRSNELALHARHKTDKLTHRRPGASQKWRQFRIPPRSLSLPFSPLTLTQHPPLGQISASLAAMQRTIEDYDAMIKREIIKAKQEKGQMYAFYLRSSPQLTALQARTKVSRRLCRPKESV